MKPRRGIVDGTTAAPGFVLLYLTPGNGMKHESRPPMSACRSALKRSAPGILGLLTVVLSLCLPPSAGAVNVAGLYQARVQVPDQSGQAREDALGTALGRVLLRLSGSSAEGLSASVNNVDAYVQQYQYETDSSGQLQLVVEFSRQAVEKLLRQNGQVIWGDERPATLVWLAVKNGGQREIISRSSKGQLAQALRRQGRLRGLPLALPLMDQQDRSAVAFADIWGGFLGQVMDASKRYQANAVLVGRLAHSGGSWQGRWTLMEGGNQEDWQTSGEHAVQALQAATRQLADRYIRRFASADNAGGETVAMTVAGIQGLGAYAKVLRYLGGLSAVSSVTVVGVQGDRMLLSLALNSSASNLEQLIGLGHTLRKASAQSAPEWTVGVSGQEAGPPLYYRLAG